MLKNEEKIFNFLKRIQDWVKSIQSVRFSLYKKKISIEDLANNRFISSVILDDDKEPVEQVEFSLKDNTFIESLWKLYDYLVEKWHIDFEDLSQFHKEYCWYIELINNDWFICAKRSSSTKTNSKEDFIKYYKEFLFLFWIETTEEILKRSEKNKDQSWYLKPIDLNVEEKIKSINYSEYWFDWYYIDEDFSIWMYFEKMTFEEIRDWKLIDLYRFMIDKYENIFTESVNDLYINYIPCFSWHNSMFISCFFDTFLNWKKKHIKYLDDFYEKNKEFIKEFSRKNRYYSTSFLNSNIRLDIFWLMFLRYVNWELTKDNIDQLVQDYFKMSVKIDKFVWMNLNKRKKILDYIKNTWDFEFKNLDKKLFWNKRFCLDYLSLILDKNLKKKSEDWVWYEDYYVFLNYKDLINISKYIWRELDKKDLKFILDLWENILNFSNEVKNNKKWKNEAKKLFKYIYDFLLEQSNNFSIHDITYSLRSAIFKDKETILIFNDVFENFDKFDINEYFSIQDILLSNEFKYKFWKYKNHKELIVYLYSFENTFFELSKKDIKRIWKYKEQMLEQWILLNDVLSKTFNKDKTLFDKLTKNWNKVFNKEFQTFSKYYVNESWKLVEISEYFKRLLWTRETLWESIKPWSLFFQMRKKNLLWILDWVYTDIFEIKELLKKYSKKVVKLERISIKLEKENSIWFWCSWNFSNCCMWYTSWKLKSYLTQRWFSLISIYLWNKIIWNSIIYSWYLWNKKVLVLDNIEMKNSEKKNEEFIKEEFIKFLKLFIKENWFSEVYQWASFNDLYLYSKSESKDNTWDKEKEDYIKNEVKILWLEIDLSKVEELKKEFEFYESSKQKSNLSNFQKMIRSSYYFDSKSFIQKVL